jgi:hypothetical protein
MAESNRILENCMMYSFINFYLSADDVRIMEERLIGWSCRMIVTWGMHIGWSETRIYTELQTQWHIHSCHRWPNSVCHTWLHSHCSNTINISTVVMLGFGCVSLIKHLSLWLCLWLSAKLIVRLFKFSICILQLDLRCWEVGTSSDVICCNLRPVH